MKLIMNLKELSKGLVHVIGDRRAGSFLGERIQGTLPARSGQCVRGLLWMIYSSFGLFLGYFMEIFKGQRLKLRLNLCRYGCFFD